MDKKNKICLIIIVICTILVIVICCLAIYKKKEEKSHLSDAQMFKEEYEAYNDLTVGSTDSKYEVLNISEDNPIKYKSVAEIINVLNTETALIYFGYPTCLGCRSIVPMLLDVAKEEGLKTIYYVDVLNVRDEYEFNGSMQPLKLADGTKEYHELVELISNHLEDYYVMDANGNKYGTGIKRLIAPTLIATSGGEIKKFFTLENSDSYYEGHALEKDYYDLAKEKIKEVIEPISLKENVVCSDKGC